MKLTIEIEVDDTLCKDLLTTAYEGGSAYWLACASAERDEEGNVCRINGPVDAETDEPFDDFSGDITVQTMQLGIERILSGQVDVPQNQVGWLLESVLDKDQIAWDADTADLVLQAGMFNDIVFG